MRSKNNINFKGFGKYNVQEPVDIKKLKNELHRNNINLADIINYLIEKNNNLQNLPHNGELECFYLNEDNEKVFLRKTATVNVFSKHDPLFIEFVKYESRREIPTPHNENFFNRDLPTPPPNETFNQFRSKILAVFTMIFGLLGLLFSETLGSYMLIVGAISIPIIIRKTTKTIIVPALCFVIIAIINYFLTGISPILAGAFGGLLFSLFFGYYFSRPLFKYQNDLHENIVKQLWFIALVLLLINIVVVIPFEFDNKNIQETSTPTSLVSSIIHSEGQLRISQTWSADLDEGVVGGSMSDRDFWFVAETHTKRYLSPSNGVKMAIVGTTSVGINGCKTARLLQNRIDINDLSEGTYVCVLTDQGRYSEFRVDEPINPSPSALIITYTTWETANPQSYSTESSSTPTNFAIPKLISPSNGDVLDNGRSDWLDYTTWNFDWSDVEGANQYQLYVKGTNVPNPIIDTIIISSSSYTFKDRGYITGCATGSCTKMPTFAWKVRAQINGQWREWSDERKFTVEMYGTDPIDKSISNSI